MNRTNEVKENLVIEIKPMTLQNDNDAFPSPPPPISNTLSHQASPVGTFPPPPPPIAPKNFSLKAIKSKPQNIVANTNTNNRANLLEAIKNFNTTNLRKSNIQQK